MAPAYWSVLFAFGLAFLAQYLLSTRGFWADGLVLYASAAYLLVRFLRRTEAPRGAAPPPPEADLSRWRLPARRWHRQALLVLIVGALAAFLGSGQNHASLGLALVLGLAVAAYLYLLLRPGWNPVSSRSWLPRYVGTGGLRLAVGRERLALVAIVLVGAGYRLFDLTGVPAEMISDHAEKYLDIESIQNGARPIFFPTNGGREGTQFYLAAVLAGLTGYTYLTLKLVSCAASIAAIPAVYLFGRTLYGAGVGLLAALLFAISKWDVSVARFATRAEFAAMWSAICLFLTYRAIFKREPNTFIWLGLAMGLGFYGYTSFRIVAFFVALLVVAAVLFDPVVRAERRQVFQGAASTYGLALLIAIPLIRYGVDFPQQFLLRSATRLTEAEQSIVGGPLRVFLGNVWNMVLMFNWQGDRSWLQIVPKEPSLDWVTGALFVLGVLYGSYRAVVQRDLAAASLIAGIFVLTLPSTLALAFPIENPHLSRASAALPVVMVLAALPLVFVTERCRAAAWATVGRRAAMILGAALLVLAAQANFQSYFKDYGAVHRLTSQNQAEVAEVIGGYTKLVGTNRSAWIVSWPFWIDHRVVALELGDFAWKERAVIDRAEDAVPHRSQSGPKLYVLHQDDVRSLEVLRGVYPEGIVHEYASAKPGKSFRGLYVPR